MNTYFSPILEHFSPQSRDNELSDTCPALPLYCQFLSPLTLWQDIMDEAVVHDRKTLRNHSPPDFRLYLCLRDSCDPCMECVDPWSDPNTLWPARSRPSKRPDPGESTFSRSRSFPVLCPWEGMSKLHTVNCLGTKSWDVDICPIRKFLEFMSLIRDDHWSRYRLPGCVGLLFNFPLRLKI